MTQKNPAKGSSIKTSLIRLECYLNPVAAASATVFAAIPQELQNISYSVAYHLLADADSSDSVACVRAMAAQCTAVGWNRYWVKKALEYDAQKTPAPDAVDEAAEQRISLSSTAASDAGVTELPCLVWNGKCFSGADALEKLVDELIQTGSG